MLLVICGMFLRATGAMDRKELGFQPDGLLVASLNLADEGYPYSPIETLLAGGSS